MNKAYLLGIGVLVIVIIIGWAVSIRNADKFPKIDSTLFGDDNETLSTSTSDMSVGTTTSATTTLEAN